MIKNIKDFYKGTIKLIKRRYSRVVEESKDVKKALGDLWKQVKDVFNAIGGSERKGRKKSK